MGWQFKTRSEKFNVKWRKMWKSSSARFNFPSESPNSVVPATESSQTLANLCLPRRWKFISETVTSEMATQAKADDESYKREYRRIKSLVSSAYVRQTSVSFFLASVLRRSKLWGIAGTCFDVAHVPSIVMSWMWFTQFARPMSAFCAVDEKNCYWIRGMKEVSIVMQHIRRMGSDCLIFIDSTTNRKAPEKFVFTELSGGTVKTRVLHKKSFKVS